MPIDEKIILLAGRAVQNLSIHIPWRRYLLIALGTGMVTGITAPPAAAQWCNNGSRLTNVERAICGDRGLIDKDRELNALYKSLGGRKNARLRTGQRDWLRSRNSCTTLGCLEVYYDDRILVLREMRYGNHNAVAPAPPPPPAAAAPARRSSESAGSVELEKLPDLEDF